MKKEAERELDRQIKINSCISAWDSADSTTLERVANDVHWERCSWRALAPFVAEVLSVVTDEERTFDLVVELATCRWLEHQPEVHKLLCNDYPSANLAVGFKFKGGE